MHKNGRAKKMNKISQERLDRGRVCNFETCKDSMKDCTESLTFHLCNIAFLLNKPKWFNSTFYSELSPDQNILDVRFCVMSIELILQSFDFSFKFRYKLVTFYDRDSCNFYDWSLSAPSVRCFT